MKNKFSSSYQNQIVNAIKLFFKIVKESSIETDKIHRPKREKKLPNVLSKEEVFRILDATENLKHKTIITTITILAFKDDILYFSFNEYDLYPYFR